MIMKLRNLKRSKITEKVTLRQKRWKWIKNKRLKRELFVLRAAKDHLNKNYFCLATGIQFPLKVNEKFPWAKKPSFGFLVSWPENEPLFRVWK